MRSRTGSLRTGAVPAPAKPAQIRSATDLAENECRFCGELLSSREFFPGAFWEWSGPLPEKGPPTGDTAICLARQNVRDALDRAADVVGQQRDGTDHGERDHGENHAVLRHRLSLLAPAQRVCGDLHEGEELQHLIHLPSLIDAHARTAREFPEGKTGRTNWLCW